MHEDQCWQIKQVGTQVLMEIFSRTVRHVEWQLWQQIKQKLDDRLWAQQGGGAEMQLKDDWRD